MRVAARSLRYLCRQVLTLAASVATDEAVQRLDRMSATLKDASKTQCLPCPAYGTDCPPGTEFLDGRVHSNALQCASGCVQSDRTVLQVTVQCRGRKTTSRD